MQSAQQNLKLQKWITLLSVVLFVLKIAAYYFTHSMAILTDALESIVNVIAGFIGLYSLYVAAKPRDIDHPYGHGKAEFVSAAVEGGLIVAAGIMILYETIQNLIHENPLESLDTGLILIAITAVINYVAGTYCINLGKKNNSMALMASGKHLQVDTYSTAAIILGLGLMLLTKLYWLDKAIAGVMGLFIIYNGYKIIRSSLAGIMDEADMELLNKFIAVLNERKQENWIDLHNLRVIKYGSLLHVDCHFTVPWYLNVHEAHREIDALASLIQQEFGDRIELFVHTDGCLPFSCSICSKTDCTVRQHPFQHKIAWTMENLVSNKKHQLDPVS
ncbi:MAG: cation diffusion facilitator family transporter [Bacteroidetes bacterium 24-39-8]|jgi:cation diffusion facilitator family transporter|nr:MAG: cation diffusion facilitator family transporter [Sphingobacteriia bacterium 35-40-8]OYZ48478.1 MAG: cation diffusion facilitator family transporter [Bacteroidetes bacterium 24-39-8]OZA66627.1 MAG: cation diffusion facilitator family transporter [Sphingobacteriia bacterium 39-39-8]HQR91980.1 cation diffusion facilitator family transporter [Sediminibacterium sp.]HQS54007.1 cation diffusion facilitator family transporter [Sediminibacterium sp.]